MGPQVNNELRSQKGYRNCSVVLELKLGEEGEGAGKMTKGWRQGRRE